MLQVRLILLWFHTLHHVQKDTNAESIQRPTTTKEACLVSRETEPFASPNIHICYKLVHMHLFASSMPGVSLSRNS